MHKGILIAGIFALTLLFTVQGASAAYYYNDYSRQYSYQESYGPYGHTVTERQTNQNPWGSSTTYRKVQDNYGPGYYGYYSNPVSDYWRYGPQPRYTYTYNTYNGYNTYAYPVYAQSNYYPYREHSCTYDYCGPRSSFSSY